MALQFVLGSSGSGKTEYIYERLVRQAGEHPKKNYLVIVPEQFTMQTQQKLVELAPNHAIMNIDVLSFKRLAYRVFDDMGMQDIQVLEETGKNLVLRRLAQEQEETLTVLRANMNRMGYIGEVKSMISELVQYRISPEQLVSCASPHFFSNLTFFFVPHPKSDFFTLYLHNGMPIRNYRANIIRYFRKSVSLATKFISDDEKAYFSIIYPACRRVACPRKQLRVQLPGNACVRTFYGFGRTQYLPDRGRRVARLQQPRTAQFRERQDAESQFHDLPARV